MIYPPPFSLYMSKDFAIINMIRGYDDLLLNRIIHEESINKILILIRKDILNPVRINNKVFFYSRPITDINFLNDSVSVIDVLNKNEKEYLSFLNEGLSNKDISKLLGWGFKKVCNIRCRIYEKSGVNDVHTLFILMRVLKICGQI